MGMVQIDLMECADSACEGLPVMRGYDEMSKQEQEAYDKRNCISPSKRKEIESKLEK
jgi:hypothetical protein